MTRNDRFPTAAATRAALAAALLLGACQDIPLAPRDFAGDYALGDVNGAPLPASLGAATTPAGECTLDITAGELVLDGRRFDLSVAATETCGDETTPLSGAVGGQFTLFTEALVLSPEGALDLGGWSFTLGEARRYAGGFRVELERAAGPWAGTYVLRFTLAR